MPAYRRFVALGDSQTEGLNDFRADGTPRGWADRLAEHLARTTSPDLTYANLAVRGCRAKHVVDKQLPRALELRPDLAAVIVGMNDVLRHDFKLDETVDQVESVIAVLHEGGAQVLTMTFPDIARMIPVMGWLRPREVALNTRLTKVAERYDAAVLDLFPLPLCGDPAMWSHDRIHGSAVGHERIAMGMADLLGLPGADADWKQPIDETHGLATVVRRDAVWLASFLGPFLYRQLTGKGTGADRDPKRPDLLPVVTAADQTDLPDFA